MTYDAIWRAIVLNLMGQYYHDARLPPAEAYAYCFSRLYVPQYQRVLHEEGYPKGLLAA
jgi:hypothetical protein